MRAVVCSGKRWTRLARASTRAAVSCCGARQSNRCAPGPWPDASSTRPSPTGPASRRRRPSSGGGGSRPSRATPRRSACGSSKLHKRPPTRNTAPPNYGNRGAALGQDVRRRVLRVVAPLRGACTTRKPPRPNNTARRYRYSAHLRGGRRNRPPGPFCGGGGWLRRSERWRARPAQGNARSPCSSASRCGTCAGR